METIVIVLLLIVFGGGALLVGLIVAIVTGSARSDRLRRLEQEQAAQQQALNDATGRVASLEKALGEAMLRLSYVHAAQLALGAHAPEQAPQAAPQPAPAPQPLAEPAPAPRSEAPVAEREPAAAPREAPVAPAPDAPPPPAAPAPLPDLEAPPPLAAPQPVMIEAPAPLPPAPAPQPYAGAARAQEPEPPPSAAAPPSAPAPARFDWERWVGVRGAAAVGACVLVIAGLYFFKYSIENDLVPPSLRVVLGVLVGLGGIFASELMLRRSYTVLANWLAGAGVAILYSAFWYAHQQALVPSAAAFGLMILVTVTCGLLAVRHDATVIAILGLLGGFTTPVAISTGEDHPLGLFGYLLMLDGALLYLARRKRWPVLAALSLLGTALYQVAWIGARMGPERLPLGIGILVVFGGVYALAAPAPEAGEGESWKLTRAATVLLPFGFGLYFGLRDDLGDDPLPLAVMLCVVSAGAAWMARARSLSWASPVAAVAGTTALGAWLLAHDRNAQTLRAALAPVALAVVFHAFVELDERRPHPASRPSAARAAALATVGTLACLVAAAAAPASLDPRPWVAGWLVLTALAVRQSLFPGYAALRLGVAFLVNLGFVAARLVHGDELAYPVQPLFLVGVLTTTGLSLLSAALLARSANAPATLGGTPRPPGTRSSPDELGVLLPFVTAAYFATCAEIGPHVVPLALMLVALAAGAAWAARARRASAWITGVAAVLGLGTLALWMAEHSPASVPWEASLAVCAFAAVPAVFAAVDRVRGATVSSSIARWAVLAPVGGILVLAGVASSPACVVPWPWLAGWTALAALALWQLASPGREQLHLAPALALGSAFPVVQAAHAGGDGFPGATSWSLAALATALAVLGASLVHREKKPRRWAAHGSVLLALLLMTDTLVASAAPAPPALVFLFTLVLAAIAHTGAARLGDGGWSFAAVVVTALLQAVWTFAHVPVNATDLAAAHAALVGQGLAVVLAAAWPLVAGSRLRASLWAWRAAALAGPLGFAGLYVAWEGAFGKGAIGLLPVALGAVTLAAAWRALAFLPEAKAGPVRRSALVWLLGVTLAAVSLAIPLQLENEWITVGWAIEGAALLALWRRLDHAGLKYTALGHLAVVAVRLSLNEAVLGYHPRSSVPVFNWLAYTYWLPTAALFGAWYLLHDLEVPRARRWESSLYAKGSAVWAMTAAAAGIVVFFVWINLTIFDFYGTGSTVEVVFERLPARDLTLSLAWAIYALLLLGVGMARRSAALRWTSLALIIVTIGKVFLYDLSHLRDLYRVVSLVGLAFSLILISLLYQRFVFGKREEGQGP